jgi:hypothetical protein
MPFFRERTLQENIDRVFKKNNSRIRYAGFKTNLGVLATTSSDGTPESGTVEYAYVKNAEGQIEIIIDTNDRFRKFVNFKEHEGEENASLTVRVLRRQVQYTGVAREVEGEELQRYQQLYFQQVPGARRIARDPHTHTFVIRPTEIRYTNTAERNWMTNPHVLTFPQNLPPRR